MSGLRTMGCCMVVCFLIRGCPSYAGYIVDQELDHVEFTLLIPATRVGTWQEVFTWQHVVGAPVT